MRTEAKFIVVTTDSSHGRKIYPNRAGTMVHTDVDQLWVADITYIRLSEEFVFLALILDACSRRVIGWALDRTLENKLTLAALEMALHDELFSPGWSITPTGAHSTPAATTRTGLKKAALKSVCRARPIRGTTRHASRS